MALITCKDCNKEFSTDSRRCPHCGAKPKKDRTGLAKKFVIGLLALGLFGVLSDPPPPLPDNQLAPQMCQDFVKKSLHDPSSADFDWWTEYPMEQEKGGVFHVQVSLRAKNGFGALRRMVVDCRVVKVSPGKWGLVSLKEL